MKEKKKIYPNPKFENVVDEDKYWKTHSPISEGYPSQVQQEKQKRSSFLTIRLTGEELTQLRDLASLKGMGPSTYIRALIKGTLTPRQDVELVLSERLQQFQSILQSRAYEKKARGTSMVKENSKEQYKVIQDSLCILETTKLQLNQEILDDLSLAMLPVIYQIISNACIKVIASRDAEFNKLINMAIK